MSPGATADLLDAGSSAVVRALPGLAGIDLGIAAGDDMLAGIRGELGGDLEQALVSYLRSGADAAAVWSPLLGRLAPGGRVLDFASGYGRITRFLLRSLHPRQLVVADVDPAAMAFQAAHFGIEARVAPADPADFLGEISDQSPSCERFELILVTSLFTHLPLDLTRGWLASLAALLAPGGKLAFTVHDLRLLDPQLTVTDGFHFEAISESRVLDRHRYGSTWIGQERVRSLVGEVLPGARLRFLPRIFGERQDLVLVDAPVDVSREHGHEDELQVDHPAFAYLESARLLEPGRLVLSGWGLDFGRGAPLARIEVLMGGGPVATTLERFTHRDVASRYTLDPGAAFGFRLELDVNELTSLASPIVLVGRTEAGVESVLEARTLEGFLLRNAELTLAQYRDELRFWRGRFAEVEAAHVARGLELARLEAKLEATRASRFWKLRELWFRCKRAIGLPAVD